MITRKTLVHSAMVLGVLFVSVMIADAAAGGLPLPQCEHVQYCYDGEGNLTSTTTAYGGVCRINQKCVGDGGCDPTPWAVADCVDQQ